MTDDLKVSEDESAAYENHIESVEGNIRFIIKTLKEEPYSRERDSELVSRITAFTRDDDQNYFVD